MPGPEGGLPRSELLDTESLGRLANRLPVGFHESRRVVERFRRLASRWGPAFDDAGMALAGDVWAAARLRVRFAAGNERSSALRRLPDDDVLTSADVGKLIAGICWAARSPEEANVMVNTAMATLAPFALLASLADSPGTASDGDLVGAVQILDGMIGLDGPLSFPDDGPPLGPDDGPLGPIISGDASIGKLHWTTHLIPATEWGPSPAAICGFIAAQQIFKMQEAAPAYAISAVDPAVVCRHHVGKGPIITISGTGFGTTPGTVAFHSENGANEYIEVSPTTWADTLITVEVPVGAASGPLEIRSLIGQISVCGVDYPVFRLASQLVPFEAWAAAYALDVNGLLPPAVFDEDTDVQINWKASSGPSTTVQISVTRMVLETGAIVVGPQLILTQSGGGSGTVTYHTAKNINVPEAMHILLAVENGCTYGDQERLERTYGVGPKMTLPVYSLEVTQGLQVHPGGLIQDQVQAQLPASSLVVSIAGKDTIVRGYVGLNDGGLFGDSLPGVTGKLVVDGVTLHPLMPTVTARETVHRRPIESTLNFRIPAALCVGTKTLTLHVTGTDPFGRQIFGQSSISWTWVHSNPLKTRWVAIDSTRNPPIGPDVSDTEGHDLMVKAFDYLPHPATDIARCSMPTMGTSQNFWDLGDHGGVQHILDALDDLRDDANRPDELWVGIMGVECGGKGKRPGHTAVCGNWAGGLAHEIGHTRGCRHVEGGCEGNWPKDPIPLWPPGIFINQVPVEVHVDPKWNPMTVQTLEGTSTKTLGDLMSYCCILVTSPATWTYMYNVGP